MIIGRIYKAILLTALGCMLVATQGMANEPVSDPKFEALSKKIPGFQRILNTPPVPDTRFLNADNEAINLKAFAWRPS